MFCLYYQTKATLSVLDKFETKTTGQEVVKPGKGFTLFISNEDMDDIIKIVESLEKSCLLMDDVTKTNKLEIKKQEVDFLGAMMTIMAASLISPVASSLIQPVPSSLINAITAKGVMKPKKEKQGRFLSVTKGGTGYDNMDHMHKNILFPLHPLSNIAITKYFN